jgi:AcrR family transcriptional regulator
LKHLLEPEDQLAETQTSIAEHEATETRDRILAAAERLFAGRGYEATSVRHITTEAGCNVAAVNYHFGGKEKLYVETFRGLLGELRDRRIRRIRSDMKAAGDSATLELFVESMANAFLEPFVEEARGRMLMAFVSREMIDRRLPPSVFLGEFIGPILEAAMEEMERVAPRLEAMTARLCLMSLVGQLLHVLRAHYVFGDGVDIEIVPKDLGEHVRHVVRFSAGGIRACAAHSNGAEHG